MIHRGDILSQNKNMHALAYTAPGSYVGNNIWLGIADGHHWWLQYILIDDCSQEIVKTRQKFTKPIKFLAIPEVWRKEFTEPREIFANFTTGAVITRLSSSNCKK